MQDVRFQLRAGSTLLWLLVMPPIFFFFIGTATGGFTSTISGGQATPITVVAEDPGFVRAQIDLRLADNDFAPDWVGTHDIPEEASAPTRTLTFDAGMSNKLVQNEPVSAAFETEADALQRQFEEIRIQRALYTVLADIVVAESAAPPLSGAALAAVNGAPRVWQLDVSPAGQRRETPTGFEQAVPGMLVMFTLLVLLTSGATMLVQERSQGLLRRLASAPITRTELIAGKWQGRMILAAIQVTVALLFGTFLFNMDWGPNLLAVVVVLAAWAGFCASAGLWLGTLAHTEAQASGLGVLASCLLAALGGCWWPIEITPDWMQTLQKMIPTGWTMDALHKLVSFEADPSTVVPNVLILLAAAVVFGALAGRRFEYQ